MKNRILYITPVTAAVFGGILWLTSGSTNQFRNVPVFGQTYLEEIRDKGEVTIATRNSPTTFYEGRDGTYQGFEYDLIENFAQKMGIKTRFIVKDSINEIFEAIDTGEAMVAAAGLSISPTRMQKYLFGPSYQQVNQQVVCRRGNPMPSTLEGLKDVTLWVASETSYIERLMILKQQIPELKWQTVKDLDTEQLLEKVWNEEVNCTIADSNIVAINNRYYPELYVAFNLGDADNLAWALPLKAYELQAQMRLWLHEIHENGELDRLHDRYYGFAESFDYVDTTRFQQRVKTRLPRYIDLFHKYAEENNLPWSLLAAQSYQESNWRPRAMSPTGVRGMMMLTLPTAADMGVSSRLNAEQSIKGGAKYFVKLRNQLPEHIQEPDRTYFALAAYNVGMGHIYDARDLTRKLGKDPDKWNDVEGVLPLLSQKKYYKQLRHGYARGSESVAYVNRVRGYYDILERQHSQPMESFASN